METNIQAAISTASPISAYGIKEKPKSYRFLRFIGGLFCIGILLGALAAYFISFPIPEKPRLLGMIHGGKKLPEHFPLAWRESLQPSLFPVLIGLSSEKEQLEPFAVILRIQPTPGLDRQNLGPFALIRSKPGTTQSKRLYTALPFLWRLRQAPAVFSLYIYEDNTNEIQFNGPFDGHLWKTNLSFPNADKITSIPNLPNAINLEAFPKAQSFIQTQLEQTLGLPSEPLQSLAWENQGPNFTELELTFTQPVPASSTIAFLGAFGLRDQTQLTLEDGTVVQEYRLPNQLFLTAGTTTSWQPSSSTTISVSGSTLKFATVEVTKTTIPSCPGTPVFRLNQKSLNQVSQALNLPLEQFTSAITGSIQAKKLIVCVD